MAMQGLTTSPPVFALQSSSSMQTVHSPCTVPPRTTAFPPPPSSPAFQAPASSPSVAAFQSARSRGKRRAATLDDDYEMGSSSRKQRRTSGWADDEMKGVSWPSMGHPQASAPAFGLRPVTRHSASRSRPAPLALPSRAPAFFRRSSSADPPCSPTACAARHDRAIDTLNDSLCRAQNVFVAGFAKAQQQQQQGLRASGPNDEDTTASPMAISPVPSRRSSHVDIPQTGGAEDGVPELCASGGSGSSSASSFEGRFDCRGQDSDEDEIIMDPKRRSVDDLSYLMTKTDLSRPSFTRRTAFWDSSSRSDAGDLDSRQEDFDLGFD